MFKKTKNNSEIFDSGILTIDKNLIQYEDGFAQIKNVSSISVQPPEKKKIPALSIVLIVLGLAFWNSMNNVYFLEKYSYVPCLVFVIGLIWLVINRLTQPKEYHLYVFMNSGFYIAFGSKDIGFLKNSCNKLKECINLGTEKAITFDFSNCQISDSQILNSNHIFKDGD